MSSKNRKFRKRTEDDDPAAPAPPSNEIEVGQSPAALVAARKAKEKDKKSGRKPALLSFEDDEAPSPVKAKEKSISHKEETKFKDGRLKSKAKPNLQGLRLDDPKASSTQRSAPGEYSAERLRELKANAKTFTGPKAPEGSTVAEQPKSDGGFKLSGSFKPAAAKVDDRFDPIQTAAQSSRDTGNRADDSSAPSSQYSTVGQVPVKSKVGGKEKSAHADDGVPSAELIRLAKQKRERLRSAHLAPDYIPLGGAVGLKDLESRLRPEGALSRGDAEAGESGSDEDPDRRTVFVGNEEDRIRQGLFSRAAQEPQVQAADEDEDDTWVREQIRKGVGGIAAMSQPASDAIQYANARQGTVGSVQGSRATAESLALTGDTAFLKLQEDLRRLKMKQANIEKEAEQTQRNMQHEVEAVNLLEEEIEAAGHKYSELQRIKAYFADLCDMLQSKSALVEQLEEDLMNAGAHRAAVFAERCAEDESAEYEPASAGISAALNILSRGGQIAEARESAESASRHAEQNLGKRGEAQFDEFGRDISLEGNTKEADRKQRLQDRNLSWKDNPDGLGGGETTDESDGEEREFESVRRNVLEAARDVFHDADEQFSTCQAVKTELERWKRGYPDAYAQAYAPMSVPAIFAPFVRNELLTWDPVFQETKDFDRQKWFTLLFDFGQDGKQASDDDAYLVPKLISDLVCPLAKHAIQVSWNAFSRKQTRRVVKFLDLILVYLENDDGHVQELFAEVKTKLEACIPLVKLPPWPAAAVEASPRAQVYMAHQFGKAVRLASNIAAFDALLPRTNLISMTMERLYQRQVMVYLTGDKKNLEAAIKRNERFVTALPVSWFSEGQSNNSMRHYREQLLQLANLVESKKAFEKVVPQTMLHSFVKVLKRAGHDEAARKISKKL